MIIQYLIVMFALATAIAYAAWRICRIIHSARDRCYGCDGCQLKATCKGKQSRKTEK